MKVTRRTKISEIIKHDKNAIEAIISVNSHFEKLRNPILRKVLAPRVTIEDAARIGKCKVNDLFSALSKIGFETEHISSDNTESVVQDSKRISEARNGGKIKKLEVRPTLSGGADPFTDIMKELKTVPEGYALEVINTFEPTPLIKILEKKGYESMVVTEGDVVRTYFLKTGDSTETEKGNDSNFELQKVTINELDSARDKFAQKVREVDVRNLEMPLPMVTILGELEELPDDYALYVHHKKIPQYLLPELKDRGFKSIAAEIDEGNVKMLIHR